MRAQTGTSRTGVGFPLVIALSIALAACGGGGGGAASSGSTPALLGPAAVDVSISAAGATGSAAPPVTVAGSGTVPSADPAYLWPEEVTQVDPRIAHVYMEVVKVSLMPSGEAFESGDMEGDIQAGDSPGPALPPDKPHFVTIVPDSPVCIDLLKLENGKKLARFLNTFDGVPAGVYDKIRVYYRNVKVVLEDGSTVRFHPTANSKFDIHFRQGHELEIAAATDTTQRPEDGWIRFFRVKLDVVGLKLGIVNGAKEWDKAKVILRPQIFAEFVPPILYSVAGTAMNVPAPTLPVSGTFDISYGAGPGYPRIIPVVFDGDTTWAYSDNVLGHSSWIVGNIPSPMSFPVFRSRAKVMAVGLFDPALALQATDVVFTFPDVLQGVVDNGWKPDNTFVLRLATDNVVYPKPDRFSAYYDNVETRLPLAQDNAIDNNFLVKARGYNVTGPVPPDGTPGGIEAFWISWLGVAP
jgi:hypothetical protein